MTARSEFAHLLEKLLSLPTAPFHEQFVSSLLCAELKSTGIDFHLDPLGNIIAGYGEGENVVACVAHMDHPGFEIVEAAGKRVAADWFGGVEAKYFTGSKVVIHDRSSGSVSARGVVKAISKNPQGRVEKMSLQVDKEVRVGDFGTWDLVPFRCRGTLIETKGADDLVGCAVVLSALKELKKKASRKPVLALFTRAEEQGFIGTLGAIRSRSVPLSTKIVSVETSKTLPGVALGGGPVIRLGDRTSMFHHEMVLFMDHVARELQKKHTRFTFQRRVMDGGTCEATPYQLKGYVSGGIAVPLSNYHNQGRGRIRPEAVDLKDVEAAVEFLVEMVLKIEEFSIPSGKLRDRFDQAWLKYGGRLKIGD